MHVTSDYLILHRARCRTVNRPLIQREAGRLHTARPAPRIEGRSRLGQCARAVARPSHAASAFGVTQAPRRPSRLVGTLALERRARERRDRSNIRSRWTGKASGSTSRRCQAPGRTLLLLSSMAPSGSRRPSSGEIPSAVGAHSYDTLIDATQVNLIRRDRIVDGDITAINATMAARTSHAVWGAVIGADEWSWLKALDAAWDLFEMSDEAWRQEQVPDKLYAAFATVQRPGLQIAVITKVLHIKRPRLIPVLDSLVISQIGGRASNDVGSWVAVMEHVREVGIAEPRWPSLHPRAPGAGRIAGALAGLNPRLAAVDLHTRVRAVRSAPRLGTGILAGPFRRRMSRVSKSSLAAVSSRRHARLSRGGRLMGDRRECARGGGLLWEANDARRDGLGSDRGEPGRQPVVRPEGGAAQASAGLHSDRGWPDQRWGGASSRCLTSPGSRSGALELGSLPVRRILISAVLQPTKRAVLRTCNPRRRCTSPEHDRPDLRSPSRVLAQANESDKGGRVRLGFISRRRAAP